MRNCLLVLAGLLLVNVCFSQKTGDTYNWGVGVKYQPIGISIKKYSKQGDAMELLLSKYDEGYRATFLLEYSPAITSPSKSLRFLIGPGLHASVREDKYVVRHESNIAIGMDGIIGLEWKIPELPIALQLDYQPSIDIIGNSDSYKDWGGATVRFTF